MNTGFADIRFIDGTTEQELPYWIESSTAGSLATVWLKTGPTNTIYLYYGNSTATSSSNIISTFGSGIVGYWPFNETAGTVSGTTTDRSGFGNNATLSGFVSPAGVVSAGKYGNGLSVDGVNDFAKVTDTTGSVFDITDGITIETWYQYQKSPDWARIVSKSTTDGGQPWEMYGIWLDSTADVNPLNPQQRVYFGIGSVDSPPVTTTAPYYQTGAGPQLTPGQWYHIAGKYNSATGTMTIFVNGVEYGANTYPAKPKIIVNNGYLYIGGRGEGTANWNPGKGVVDEVRIYSRAFTAQEVASHYAAAQITAAFGSVESPACYSGSGTTWSSTYGVSPTILTPTPAAPGKPTLTRISEVEVKVDWTDTNADEIGFRVYRCNSGGTGCVPVGGDRPLTPLSYNDTTATPNAVNTYKVAAFKTATVPWEVPSVPSDPITMSIDRPIALSCTAVNTTRIDCSWTDKTASETGFKIYRCEGSACTPAAPAVGTPGPGTGVGTTITFPDTSVCTNKTYRYWITAYGTGWESSPSDIYTRATPAPVVPSGLTVTPIIATQMDLGWQDASTDLTGFIVKRCQGDGCTDYSERDRTSNKYYPDTTVSASTTYCYRIEPYKTATCSSGWDAFASSPVCKMSLPGAPAITSATADHPFKITLNWTDNSSDEDGFNIEAMAGSEWVQVGRVGPGVRTFLARRGIGAKKTYTYRIKATRGSDKSYSAPFSVTTPPYVTGEDTCE
jgi:hypothetical protein